VARVENGERKESRARLLSRFFLIEWIFEVEIYIRFIKTDFSEEERARTSTKFWPLLSIMKMNL